jgi:hypothetical protein
MLLFVLYTSLSHLALSRLAAGVTDCAPRRERA